MSQLTSYPVYPDSSYALEGRASVASISTNDPAYLATLRSVLVERLAMAWEIECPLPVHLPVTFCVGER